jgi:sirohydrochlorin ferrochelatase
MTISLIAASHGTSVPAAQQAISALVHAVRVTAPHLDVREAFVDVQRPGLDETVNAVEGLAVVVPLLLTSGFHHRVDVARAVDRPNALAARVLGPDLLLTRVLLRRLRQSGATPDDVIVLGAAGSTDPRALRDVDASARMLGSAWGAPVPAGHVNGSGTPIRDVVRDARRSGRRVVVASHIMAPGFFFEQLVASGADIVTRPLLDGDEVEPELISLVLDRFADGAEQLNWASARVAAQM